MEVRPAVEADAEPMAALSDRPVETLRNVVHDRAVRVAVDGDDTDGTERSSTADAAPETVAQEAATASADDAGDVLGFVCFDATRDAVHVTAIDGTPDACERLLDEPIRFGECEDLPVELLVEEGGEEACAAAKAAGFEESGAGPRFRGQPTRRFRWNP